MYKMNSMMKKNFIWLIQHSWDKALMVMVMLMIWVDSLHLSSSESHKDWCMGFGDG